MGVFDRLDRCHNCGRGSGEGSGFAVKSQSWKSRSRTVSGDPGPEQTYTNKWAEHAVCPEKVCIERVDRNRGLRFSDWQPCSRDAKVQIDAKWLCGIHHGVHKKQLAATVKARAEEARDTADEDRATLAIAILKEVGLSARIHYANGYRGGRYDGDIVVDPADLFTLLGIAAKLPEKTRTEKAGKR